MNNKNIKIQLSVSKLVLVLITLTCSLQLKGQITGFIKNVTNGDVKESSIYWLLTQADSTHQGTTQTVEDQTFYIACNPEVYQQEFYNLYNSYVDAGVKGFTEKLDITDPQKEEVVSKVFETRSIVSLDSANIVNYFNSGWDIKNNTFYKGDKIYTPSNILALAIHGVPMVKLSSTKCANLIYPELKKVEKVTLPEVVRVELEPVVNNTVKIVCPGKATVEFIPVEHTFSDNTVGLKSPSGVFFKREGGDWFKWIPDIGSVSVCYTVIPLTEEVTTTKCGTTVHLTAVGEDGVKYYRNGEYKKEKGLWYVGTYNNQTGRFDYELEKCQENNYFSTKREASNCVSCCTTNYVKPVVSTTPQQKVITLYCGDRKPRDLQIIGLDTCYTTYNVGCGSPKVFATIYEIGVAYNDNGQPAFFRKMLNGREDYKIYSNGKWVDYCNETNKHNPTVPPSYVKKNNQWVKTAALIAGTALIAYLVTRNGQRQVYNPPSGGNWTPVSTDSNGNVVSTDNAGNFISTDQNGNIVSVDQL